MKKYMLFLLFPTLLCAQNRMCPEPYTTVAYTKERIKETTIHRVVVHPPYSLDLVIASETGVGKKSMSTMVMELEQQQHKNVIVGINGSYFDPKLGTVIGTLLYHDKYIQKEERHRAQLGIQNLGILNDRLAFGYYGYADHSPFFSLLTGGPYLVRDKKNIALEAAGKEAFSRNYDSHHPRTAIGTRADGSIVLVVVDGRRKDEKGITLGDLANYFLKEHCTEAINLDGGGSSTLVLSGEFYGQEKTINYVQNRPSDGEERAVVNGFVVIERR